MKSNVHAIGLLISNPVDRRLLTAFMRSLDYEVVSSQPSEQHLNGWQKVSLIIADKLNAQQYGAKLRIIKRNAGFTFLPLIVMLPRTEKAGPWLEAGFDDVLRLPVTKAELRVRLQAFLRLHQQSKEEYRALVENSVIGFYRTTPDGRILYANPAVLRMLGFSSVEELSQCNLEKEGFISEYPCSLFKERLEKEGQIVGLESAWIRKDRTTLFVRESARAVRDESGNIYCYEGTVEDITERKQAEQALRESEAKYRHLIQVSNDAIYLLYNRKFEVINNKFQEMFGLTLEDVNKPDFDFIDLVAPKSRALVEDRARRLANGERLEPKYEFTAIAKDGKEIDVEVSVSYIKYKDGIATQGILRDITERKRLEQQLLQAQKMEAIGRLTGGIAHDFNNILTAILGNAELLVADLAPDDPLHVEIKEIKKAADRAALLTRQLLAFSRKQSLQPKILDLNTTVASMKKMLQRVIGEDIELLTDLSPELKYIKADPAQIEQVIMNITVNSCDAMPAGGKLTINTENVIVDKDYCKRFSYARPGNFVCLSIMDTGVGMDKSIIARIFEPFFTTKGLGKGTGLGLSVVYGIVKQHEGWINVFSKVGHGTIFKVYLPALAEKLEEETKEKVSLHNLKGNGEHILLVEDEEAVRRFTKKALRENGYVVYDASNANQALDIFMRERDNIQLIFSDVVLPDITGIQLIDQLLIHKPELLILLSSGYTDQKSQWFIIQQRGFRFIHKPYTLADLLRAMREVIEAN